MTSLVNRQALILARQAALRAGRSLDPANGRSYLPCTDDEAAAFVPHDWVLDAVTTALETGRRLVEEQRLAEPPKREERLAEAPVQVAEERTRTPDEEFQLHPLYLAFRSAWMQATRGKGQRHGGDVTPFYDQLWKEVADAQGTGFLTGQAVKKLQEAGARLMEAARTPPPPPGEGRPVACLGDEAWQREVLGALVYGGMAFLHGTGLTTAPHTRRWTTNGESHRPA